MKETFEEENSQELDNKTTAEDKWIDLVGTGALKKRIIREGVVESRPSRGDTVCISFKGSLPDGTIVEECEELIFTLGDGEVIDGFDLVVALMDKDEESEIFMESRFAYGETGHPPKIPPNADMTYRIRLEDYKLEDEPNNLPLDERKSVGNRKRERGNWWFNREEFSRAIQCYKAAIDFLDDISDNYEEETTPEVKDILEERLKALNNMAAAQIKVEAFDAALISLDAVINCQPLNVKALFRKGKVLGINGETKEALDVLTKASSLDPENKSIINEMIKLREKAKEEAAKEKSLYRKMLGINFSNLPKEKERRPTTLRAFHIKVWASSFLILVVLLSIFQYRHYIPIPWKP